MNRSITILKSCFNKQGGAEKYARCLAQAFYEKGCQVTVLTTDPITEFFPFEVISRKLSSTTSFGKIWEFETFCKKYLKTHPTDIIFGHDRNCFQTHLRAGSGVHRSYLYHRKEFENRLLSFRHKLNPLHASLLYIEKLSFEHPDLKVLFANSHLVKKQIISQYNTAPQKIKVVHNGVEWRQWQESFDGWQSQKTNDSFHFLFLGSNFERKGLKPLLNALVQLPKVDFHLSVVGKDKNQPTFEALSKKLGLSKQVTFYGSQPDVRPFLQKSDCLVIPSFYDPFANVTTEALAMGLYVVSSKTNGGSEILKAETGCIIENLHDPQSMKQSLEKALSYPKTPQSAYNIRQSVKYLDFSTQLNTYLEICLSPTL